MNLKLNWLAKFKEEDNLNLLKFLLFFLIIFTSSINLFYKISLNGAYINGLLVDYLIPKFYLAEIFLIPFIIIELPHLRRLKVPSYLCLLILIILFRQLLSQSPLAAISQLVHLSEFLLFLAAIYKDPAFKTKMGRKFGLGAIFLVIIFQSLLAIYQFVFQRSLFPYKVMGESNLTDLANISKAQFFFVEKTLPYGTTAHPNILAGLIVIFSIIIFQHSKRSPTFKTILVLNALLIIFLTQSLSALLTLALFFFYLFLKRVKVNRLVIFAVYYLFLLLIPYFMSKIYPIYPDSNSIKRRVILNQASFEMFKNNILFGTGINNFTLHLEDFDIKGVDGEVVRFVQPVHNILFLILSEGGILSVLFVLLLIKHSKIEGFYRKSVILLAIAGLDHYLLTQFTGIGLLPIFYFFII